jgi:hypothetical protein
MFTIESIINTVETAKLNAIEKIVTNNELRENLKAAVRAEAGFAKTIVATTKNVCDEVANFKYAEAVKPYTAKVEELFKTYTSKF